MALILTHSDYVVNPHLLGSYRRYLEELAKNHPTLRARVDQRVKEIQYEKAWGLTQRLVRSLEALPEGSPGRRLLGWLLTLGGAEWWLRTSPTIPAGEHLSAAPVS